MSSIFTYRQAITLRDLALGSPTHTIEAKFGITYRAVMYNLKLIREILGDLTHAGLVAEAFRRGELFWKGDRLEMRHRSLNRVWLLKHVEVPIENDNGKKWSKAITYYIRGEWDCPYCGHTKTITPGHMAVQTMGRCPLCNCAIEPCEEMSR